MADIATSRRTFSVPSYALIGFFLLTFTISWGVVGMYIVAPDWSSSMFGEISGSHPFFFLATWAPAISAFVLVLYFGGVAGLKAFLSRLFMWRLSSLWVIFILIGIPVVFMIGSSLKSGPLLAPVPPEGVASMVPITFMMLFLGPIEEFGWRGVAQPLLQRHMAPLWAGMIIGTIWGVWHLPAFFLSGTVFAGWNFFPFLLGNITLAVLVTPIFNSSRGSLLWPMLFHWQLILPIWPDAQPYDTWILLVVAVVVVWWHRETMLSRNVAATEVIPGDGGGRPMISSLRAIAVLPACLLLITQATSADPSDPDADVQALLETFHEAYGFPGATAAYVASDGEVRSFAVGHSDVEAGIPMTPETGMLAASIGKTIWGALVLSLEADGLINRSDLVSEYLGDEPWFDRVPNAGEITVGHLLSHTSGLPDHVHMDGVAMELVAMGRMDPFDPADLVMFVLDEPALFKAGTAWSYTDTGYVLLGLVMEAATDASVFVLATERILLPLDLTATVPSDTTTLEGMAVGYTVEDNPFGLAQRTMDEVGRLTWNPVVEWTGGGFASTSTDLARWGHALFLGAAMNTEYLGSLLDGVAVHPDVPGVFYGAGVAIYQETSHGSVYGHGGWIPAYVSSLRHYADHDLTIAFQINSDVGVVDDSTDLVPALEEALASMLIGALQL